jgi:guanidinopropionase
MDDGVVAQTETGMSELGHLGQARFSGISTFMRASYVPDADGVEIALAGLPYDFQGGRGSARLGPAQIREMSGLIRPQSFNLVAPFEMCRVADVGNAVVNPMNPRESIDLATEFVAGLAAKGAAVVSAGGDHGVTYSAVKGLVQGKDPISLVHFDAHPDSYDDPYGGYIHHGNAIRAAVEGGYVDPSRAVSVGIHGTRFFGSDRDWHRDHGMRLLTIDDVADLGVAETVAEIRRIVGDGPTYVTFDIDVLDTPYAVGTGAPEPGGLTMREALGILRGLHGLDIIGGDVMEVAPPFDPSGHTALCAANIMFEILCGTALAYAEKRDGQ